VGKPGLRKLHGWRIFPRVKILTTFGGVLVAGKKPYPKKGGHIHDPWYAHGINASFTFVRGAGGLFYGGPTFTLLDGNEYWYPTYTHAVLEDCRADWVLDYSEPMPPDFREHYGEAYNFVFRVKAFDKVLWTDLASWINTH